MALVTIPATFGTGGSGLNPTSDPTTNLANILTQLTSAVTALQTQVGSSQSTQANPEEVSASGPLSVTKSVTRLTVSGTKAYTLADGVTAGQRKQIFCVSAASTPSGVVTPAHGSGFTTITFGAGTGNSSVELIWDASLGTPAWKLCEVVTTASGTLTIT